MEDVVVERPVEGRPHEGKVLAVVQAHADDVSFFCTGTVAKLLKEGYTGYLIQTTNDDKCGPTPSLGETIVANEHDVAVLAEELGFKQVFNLGYRNHFLDGESPLELRCRLIFLFRLLKVHTVFTFNPWGHGERNPDHYVTAQAVEAAAWIAGMDKDYPEQFAAGIEPHTVREYYYWVARKGQPFNRVVDVSAHVDTMVAVMSANKAQGPAGSTGSTLKAQLATRGLRLPALDGEDGSDEAADREYIRLFMLDEYRALGQSYGLNYAESFYYIGPPGREGPARANRVEDYIAQHAVPLTSNPTG